MPTTPAQRLMQERFEALIGLAAPVLDFVLATGERVSRLSGEDHEYYPVRSAGDALPLPPAPRSSEPGDVPAE